MDNIETAPAPATAPTTAQTTAQTTGDSFLKKMGDSATTSTYQTIIIIILTVFLILAVLGINVFTAIGRLFQSAFDVIKPVTYNTISDIGYTTGSVIHDTSNLLADAGKRGIDIVNGTIQDIGGLLIKSSGREKKEGYTAASPLEPDASNQYSYSSTFTQIDGDKYKTNSIYDPTMFSSFN